MYSPIIGMLQYVYRADPHRVHSDAEIEQPARHDNCRAIFCRELGVVRNAGYRCSRLHASSQRKREDEGRGKGGLTSSRSHLSLAQDQMPRIVTRRRAGSRRLTGCPQPRIGRAVRPGARYHQRIAAMRFLRSPYYPHVRPHAHSIPDPSSYHPHDHLVLDSPCTCLLSHLVSSHLVSSHLARTISIPSHIISFPSHTASAPYHLHQISSHSPSHLMSPS